MKRLLYIFLIVIAAISSACDKFQLSKNSDAYFHVEINNTELPVWVKGNTKSNNLLLFINGGPGLTSIDVAHADKYEWSGILENEFAMVYYDQRGCGNAQGNLVVESLTVEQYVSDLSAIIKVLKSKYESSKIYLMSHSFGSFVGANYLLDSARQSEISGWISVDGAFNYDSTIQWKYRRDFLINIAKEEISDGSRTDYWTNVLSWTSTNLVLDSDDKKEEWRNHLGYPGEGIIPFEEGRFSFGQFLSIGFYSPINPINAYLSKKQEIVNDKLNEDLKGKNIIEQVSEIKLPTLLIWGRYDDIIPIELGFDIYNNLGTSASSKSFVTMEKSSHEPFISDPQKFQIAITDFINSH